MSTSQIASQIASQVASQVTTHPTGTATTSERQPVWRHGVAAAVVAGVATTVLAATASAAGVSFADQTGESIPVAAFPQLTVFFALVGVAIAAVLARRARRPRSTFVRTTAVLAALSVVPDLTFGFDAPSAATLVGLHVVAAAIVVPALASRLARTR